MAKTENEEVVLQLKTSLKNFNPECVVVLDDNGYLRCGSHKCPQTTSHFKGKRDDTTNAHASKRHKNGRGYETDPDCNLCKKAKIRVNTYALYQLKAVSIFKVMFELTAIGRDLPRQNGKQIKASLNACVILLSDVLVLASDKANKFEFDCKDDKELVRQVAKENNYNQAKLLEIHNRLNKIKNNSNKNNSNSSSSSNTSNLSNNKNEVDSESEDMDINPKIAPTATSKHSESTGSKQSDGQKTKRKRKRKTKRKESKKKKSYASRTHKKRTRKHTKQSRKHSKTSKKNGDKQSKTARKVKNDDDSCDSASKPAVWKSATKSTKKVDSSDVNNINNNNNNNNSNNKNKSNNCAIQDSLHHQIQFYPDRISFFSMFLFVYYFLFSMFPNVAKSDSCAGDCSFGCGMLCFSYFCFHVHANPVQTINPMVVTLVWHNCCSCFCCCCCCYCCCY